MLSWGEYCGGGEPTTCWARPTVEHPRSMSEVRALLATSTAAGGDETVLDYVASVVEDPGFEFGPDCADALDAIGPVLVCRHLLLVGLFHISGMK